MKYISNIKYLALGILCSLGTSSCSGFLEEYSQDLAKVEGWKDLDEVLLGGAYLQSGRLVPQNSYTDVEAGEDLDLLHFMSDELKESGDNGSDMLGHLKGMFAYYTWQQNTGVDEKLKYVGGDEKYWDMLYSKINVTNMVISLIDEQPEANKEDHDNKERVKGEAHFLRAAYYFLLVNLYGEPYVAAKAEQTPGVPIKTTEYVEDEVFERQSVAEVYRQIISDLEIAEQCLQDKNRASIYHANRVATHLLQSRVYLYMQNWEKAAAYAQTVIKEQGNLLDLHIKSPGDNILYKDSPETIFSMGGYLICTEFSTDGKYDEPAYYLSDDMLDLYADEDLRSSLYIGETDNGCQDVFMKVNGQPEYWGSYYDTSSCFLLRTPEAYLTLAEASAYNGDEDTARRTLERFLATRMETPVSVTESGEELISFIRNERAREFLLEGQRWFDLRRYTVCSASPWSKVIEHGHIYYANYSPDYADWYHLEKNDQAYTLPIPQKTRSFQVSLGNNERPARAPFKTEQY